MSDRVRLSIWSGPRFLAGTKLVRFLPPGIEAPWEESVQAASDRLNFMVPSDGVFVPALSPGTIVQQEFRGEIREWIVETRNRRWASEANAVTITCMPIHHLLRLAPIERRPEGGIPESAVAAVNLSPREMIGTFVVPQMAYWGLDIFRTGLVQVSTRDTLAMTGWTPMQVLDWMAERFEAAWNLRADESAQVYRIDFGEDLRGDEPIQITLREGRQLSDFEIEDSADDLHTAVMVRGDIPEGGDQPATIADAVFRVTSVEPDGGDDLVHVTLPGGGSPIIEDGQHVGLRLMAPDLTTEEIIGTTAPGARAVLTAATRRGQRSPTSAAQPTPPGEGGHQQRQPGRPRTTRPRRTAPRDRAATLWSDDVRTPPLFTIHFMMYINKHITIRIPHVDTVDVSPRPVASVRLVPRVGNNHTDARTRRKPRHRRRPQTQARRGPVDSVLRDPIPRMVVVPELLEHPHAQPLQLATLLAVGRVAPVLEVRPIIGQRVLEAEPLQRRPPVVVVAHIHRPPALMVRRARHRSRERRRAVLAVPPRVVLEAYIPVGGVDRDEVVLPLRRRDQRRDDLGARRVRLGTLRVDAPRLPARRVERQQRRLAAHEQRHQLVAEAVDERLRVEEVAAAGPRLVEHELLERLTQRLTIHMTPDQPDQPDDRRQPDPPHRPRQLHPDGRSHLGDRRSAPGPPHLRRRPARTSPTRTSPTRTSPTRTSPTRTSPTRTSPVHQTPRPPQQTLPPHTLSVDPSSVHAPPPAHWVLSSGPAHTARRAPRRCSP